MLLFQNYAPGTPAHGTLRKEDKQNSQYIKEQKNERRSGSYEPSLYKQKIGGEHQHSLHLFVE